MVPGTTVSGYLRVNDQCMFMKKLKTEPTNQLNDPVGGKQGYIISIYY